jgi:tetratricopeptide (TPR) repeat protein
MAGGTRAERAWWADEPFVGRDELLDELAAVAGAAACGAGSIVVLTGEAGIGKTSVARALIPRVRHELAVSWSACAADRVAPPFWPWGGLIDVETSVRPRELSDTIGEPRFEQLTTLRDEVRTRALQQPRLHVIEDVQWADVASVLLLAHLGAAIVDTPLLVVATLRTGEHRSPQLDGAIEEVRRVARERDLAPLDDDAIATLIGASGTPPDEQLVSLVRNRTGGNPLFVTELLRAMRLTGSVEARRQVVAGSVPTRVSDLVVHRLRRLPEAVSDALVTAAVVGAEGDTDVLAAAHGSAPAALLDLLDQARAAHLLDVAATSHWQFHHQLVRDAVYASASAGERARRHARVLEVLAADPSTAPATIAHHGLAALPLFDPDRAVALAARAGEFAFGQRAYEEAVEWFTRALASAPTDTEPRWRAELLVLRGEAHRHIGDTAAARSDFAQAAELTDDAALLGRAALGYADPGADLGIAYRTNDAVTGALLERAVAVQLSLDSVTGVQLEARLAAERYFSEHPARSRAQAYAALDRARRLGDPRALVAATAVVHDSFVVGQASLDEQVHESAQLLDWAHASGSAAALLTARRARVLDLLAAGDLTAMDAEIRAFQQLAGPLRVPGYLWWPSLWSAMRALLEGRHSLAEERAVATFQLGATPFPSLAFLNLSFLLFFLRREQGRLHEMERATSEFAAAHADLPAVRVALVFLLAELGRLDDARGALAGFDGAALDQLRDRNWPASWFQLARAAFVVGDRPLAAVLLEPDRRPHERCVQVSLATVCLGATDLAVAWLLHAVGDAAAADRRYRSAEELNARIGARSWLAQARADHARLLFERDGAGDRQEAIRLSDLATEAAGEIGLATITATRPDRSQVSPTARFRRQGGVWELAYAERVVQLPDARGLHDLAYLLARPGDAVSVMELAGDQGARAAAGRGMPALDERARREIRARLHQLDSDEAEAEAAGDGVRAALAREQRQALAEAVARDLGLRGRSRVIGDPVERARKTVSTRIHRTIATIERSHPELGRHLERSVDTGAWCAYRPAEQVDWQT